MMARGATTPIANSRWTLQPFLGPRRELATKLYKSPASAPRAITKFLGSYVIVPLLQVHKM
jgi:hypothetical protein